MLENQMEESHPLLTIKETSCGGESFVVCAMRANDAEQRIDNYSSAKIDGEPSTGLISSMFAFQYSLSDTPSRYLKKVFGVGCASPDSCVARPTTKYMNFQDNKK